MWQVVVVHGYDRRELERLDRVQIGQRRGEERHVAASLLRIFRSDILQDDRSALDGGNDLVAGVIQGIDVLDCQLPARCDELRFQVVGENVD